VSDRLKDQDVVPYNNILNAVKTVIRFGYSQDFVKDKAWLDKLKPRKDDRKARVENKYLEPEELATLIASMDRCPHWQLLTKFLALSGLRIGEALALTPDDLDTYIHVTKTLEQTGNVSDTPKTADSNRDVFIQPELAEVISEVRKWRLSWMMAKGVRSERLFPVEYSAYYIYLRKKRELIPDKTISPHTLRHTHASLLAAAGMSLDAISRRLGHSDSAITKEVYLHVTEKLKKQEEEQLSKVKIL
jgi:integrase